MNTRQFSERLSGDRNNMATSSIKIIPVAAPPTTRTACHGAHFSQNTRYAETSAKVATVKITAHGIA